MDINCRYRCRTFFWLSAMQELYNTVTTLPPRQPHKLGKTSYSNERKDGKKNDNVGGTEVDSSKKASWVKSSVNVSTSRKAGRENWQEDLEKKKISRRKRDWKHSQDRGNKHKQTGNALFLLKREAEEKGKGKWQKEQKGLDTMNGSLSLKAGMELVAYMSLHALVAQRTTLSWYWLIHAPMPEASY